MLNIFKDLIKLLFNKKKLKYSYIIEIRPTFEKELLKNFIKKTKVRGTRTKTPHITLIYDFKPNIKPYEIMKIIKKTLNNRYISFKYDEYDKFKGDKGFVFSFKIKPSQELIKFQKELYANLKPHIIENPRTQKYNENPHFHCTIAYKIENSNHIIEPDNKIYLKSYALRISLIKDGKIVYEYDVPTGKILNRTDALSKRKYINTLKTFRKKIIKPYFYHGNYYVISDTHFYHKNIIKYCARPFADVNEMNNEIINYWNTIVKPNDTVYFLGDFTFRNKNYNKLKNVLNGNIIFIKGNHDKLGLDHMIIEYKNYKFLLVHDPKNIEHTVKNFDGWILHGHVHNNDLKNYPLIDPKKKTINVCVEVINYHPISLDGVLELIRLNKRIETIEEMNNEILC